MEQPLASASSSPSDRHAPARRAGAAGAPILVLLNTGAGAAARCGATATDELAAGFAANGLAAEILPLRGHRLAAALRERMARPAGERPAIVVAAGGDGTVRTVAQILAGGTVPLGIVPLGTRNHFARDLGLPPDIDGAVAAIAHGTALAVDAGEVNGQVFVNNASIGLYPEMVRQRDRQQRLTGWKKLPAMLLAALQVLRRLPVRRLTIEADGLLRTRRTPFAFIGNNSYAIDLASLGRRASLGEGRLFLLLASADGWRGLLGLALRAAFGRLEEERDFERLSVRELVIDARRRHLTVALDGEVLRLRPPLRFRIRPKALRVLAARHSPCA